MPLYLPVFIPTLGFRKNVTVGFELPHHPQNRPLQLVTETTLSYDELHQHATVLAGKVCPYLSQRSKPVYRTHALILFVL